VDVSNLPDATPEPMIIDDEIATRLMGQDVRAIERCWQLSRPATFDILRDRRLGLVYLDFHRLDGAGWTAVAT
jgi:hypothetical protein